MTTITISSGAATASSLQPNSTAYAVEGSGTLDVADGGGIVSGG
jgi:hypothetical protein